MGYDRKNCCEAVIPYNAARPFKKPAPVLSKPKVKKLLSQKNTQKILEIGAGNLRNALALQDLGISVFVLEVKGIENRFPTQYKDFISKGGKIFYSFPNNIKVDIVLATFVIETICNVAQRKFILEMALDSLKKNGAMIVSVRGPADLVTARAKGIRCSDGYLTPNKTFARSYTKAQLRALLYTCGFQSIDFLHKKNVKQPEYLHAIAWKEKK